MGQETGRFGLDQYLARVERDTRVALLLSKHLHVLFRDIKHRRDGKGGICLEVQRVLGIIPCIGDETIEFGVLLRCDTIDIFFPECFDCVDLLIV
jgi:hypothetical protein